MIPHGRPTPRMLKVGVTVLVTSHILIAHWNLAQLAQSIYPLIGQQEPLLNALDEYRNVFEQGWRQMMSRKLGWNSFEPAIDEALVSELLEILPLAETDITIFYRRLAEVDTQAENLSETSDQALMEPLMESYYQPAQLTNDYVSRFGKWIRDYIDRTQRDGTPNDVRRRRMNKVNPKYVLRNYLAQLAIDKAEEGDNSMVDELLELLRHPYDEQLDKQAYAVKRPEWARHRAGCSMLSCSS